MKKALVIAALLPSISYGSDIAPGPYGFISMGQSDASINGGLIDGALRQNFDPGSYLSNVGSPASTYSAALGYQVTSRFGVEAQYIKPSSIGYNATAKTGGTLVSGSVSESSHITSLDAVGNIPIPILEGLYAEAKLGIAQVKGTSSLSGSGLGLSALGSFSGSRTGLTGGVGVRYDFTDTVFARFDIDTYKTPDQSYVGSFNIWQLDIGLKF